MNRWIFFLGLGFLSFVGFIHMNCGQSVGPSGPTIYNTPTPTPVTTNSSGPLIEAFFLNVNIPSLVVGTYASVFIVDNVGNPVSTAGITLVTPYGSIPVTYSGTGPSNPPGNMGISNITGGRYFSNSTTYAPGQNCSFNITIGGTTYSTSFTALDPAGSVMKGTSGVTCTWSAGGNENLVLVTGNDTLQYGPNPAISSPYIIPAVNFASDPAGGGNDDVILGLLQEIQPAFSGGQTASVIVSGTETGTNY